MAEAPHQKKNVLKGRSSLPYQCQYPNGHQNVSTDST